MPSTHWVAAWIDYTVNGLVVGNIYALLAIGLALIFGVANLINFAHGSVLSVGAYVGWVCAVKLSLPLAVTVPVVLVACALLGVAIERLGVRGLYGRSRIAALLSTIGIGLVIDQSLQLIFSADPRALPSHLPGWRLPIGGGSVGVLDLAIAGVGLAASGGLWLFLRHSRLGMAVRATAQDSDAARMMGVEIDRVNMTVFAVASALGGLAGLLIGMYYNNIDPSLSFQATLKGIVAAMAGGLGSLPGAVLGGLLLGLVESYGIAVFGTASRNIFAFAILLLVLLVRPGGLLGGRERPAEPMTGTFMAIMRGLTVPRWALPAALAAAVLLPLVAGDYVLQVGTNVLLVGLLALGLTLVAGTAGQVSLGTAALPAIGAYASGLLAVDLGWPVAITVPASGLIAALLCTLLVAPALRLQGHYVSVATLAVAEIVGLVILNWSDLTGGAMGLSGLPPLAVGAVALDTPVRSYYVALALVAGMTLIQTRLLASHLGRTWRALRDDEVAARSFGLAPTRLKAMAFAVAGLGGGLSGAVSAHLFSYIDRDTFAAPLSILALTIVILGGLGNVAGALLGSLLLVGLPEAFRMLGTQRVLIYGVVLLVLVRARPQGLLGTA